MWKKKGGRRHSPKIAEDNITFWCFLNYFLKMTDSEEVRTLSGALGCPLRNVWENGGKINPF